MSKSIINIINKLIYFKLIYFLNTEVSILIHLGGVLLLVVGVYVSSLNNQFLWDDEQQIVENTVIQDVKNLPSLFTQGIVYIPGRELSNGFYRPILSLAYMLIYLIGGGLPFFFRLFQIFLHGLNSILVYLLFLKLFPKNNEAAFKASLVFAVHPGAAEAVLFISALGEPLYFFFSLLSFILFLTDRFYLLSLFFFFLSLLTKEAALILSLLLVLFLVLTNKRQKFFKLGGYLMIVFIYLWLRIITTGGLVVNLNFPSLIAYAPLLAKILTSVYSVVFYLRLFFFPLNLSISNQTVINSVGDIRFLSSALLLILTILAVFYFYQRKKDQLFLFFVFWFLTGLTVVLNFIPLSATVAERWLYFPMVGILGALAAVFCQLEKRQFKILSAIFMIWLVLLSLRTIRRTFDWKNGYTLYKHDLMVNPQSFELQNNYGVELFRRGEITKAKPYFQKSIELNPNWWFNYNNLGAVYEAEGDHQRAIEFYQKAIEKNDYFLAYKNLASIYLKMKNYQQANLILEKATGYFSYQADLHRLYAISLYQTQQKEAALKEAQILLRIEPTGQNYQLWQIILKGEKLPLAL